MRYISPNQLNGVFMKRKKGEGIAKRDRNMDFLKLAFFALIVLSIISCQQDIKNILETLRFNLSIFW